MFDLATPLEWSLIAVVTFVGAAVQGSIGLGFAIFSAPILALVNPGFVPVPLQLVTPIITVGALIRERTHIDFRGAPWVIAGRFPGAAIGVWLLAVASTRSLSFIIGGTVLALVIAISMGVRIPHNPFTKFTTGVVSGSLAASTAIGGPPLALLYAHHRGPEVRSTLGAIFTVGLTVNLIALGLAGHIDGDALLRAAGLAIPVSGGFLASTWVKHRFDGELLRTALLTAATFSAVALLIKAAAG